MGRTQASRDLEAAARGDASAFTRLYTDVQPRLIRYAAVLVGDDTAADVTARSWLRLVPELPAFSGDLAGFLTLAASITREIAVPGSRPVGRRDAPTESDDDQLLSASTTSAQYDHLGQEVTKELSVAEAIEVIRSLPQQQAEAVMLRAVIGLDDVSASTVLGITASEVRTSAHQGLTELRHVLKRRERAT